MDKLVRREDAPARPTRAGFLAPWDPWAEMARFHREFDDLFGRTLAVRPPTEGGDSHPPVELVETDTQFELKAHLPGVKQEDIHLEVAPDQISLSGESKTEEPGDNAKVHVRTTRVGRFKFQYGLPTEIQTDQVQASYRDGVLQVTLPKVQQERSRTVKIPIG